MGDLQPIHVINNNVVDYLKPALGKAGREVHLFVDRQGAATQYNDVSHDAIPISQEGVDYVLDSFAELDAILSLDFALVDDSSQADIRFLQHANGQSYGGSGGFNVMDYVYFGSKETGLDVQFTSNDISVNRSFGSEETQPWKRTAKHEVGHSLGLEHPFNSSDGDVYGGTLDTSIEQTLMSYGGKTPVSGPIQFTELDRRALIEVWGAEDDRSSLSSLQQLVRDRSSPIEAVLSAESSVEQAGGGVSSSYASVGKGRLRGSAAADQFIFDQLDVFGKKGADKIINFDQARDQLLFGLDALPGMSRFDELDLVTVGSKKELKSAAQGDSAFVYDNSKGRLYYNSNGDLSGFGPPDQGGLIAVLKGSPELETSNLALL